MLPQSTPQIQAWVATMRPHWIRCQGNIHNDPKFWNECIHSRDDIWHDALDFYCEARHDIDVDRLHPHLNWDLGTIMERIEQGQRITIPYNKQGYNKPVFRATMALKDILCKLTGEPMQDHLSAREILVNQLVPKRKRPSRDEVMAQYAKLGQMIDDLFETKE